MDLNQLSLGHCQFTAGGTMLACFGCPTVSLWNWRDLQLPDYKGPMFTVRPTRHPKTALNQTQFLTSGAISGDGRMLFVGDSGGGLSAAYVHAP